MLLVKDGIDTIQVPSSMIKVKRSSAPNPMHDEVAVVVNGISPGDNTLGRKFGNYYNGNGQKIEPTTAGLKNIDPPTESLCMILIARGVEEETLSSCKFIMKA